MLIEKHGDGISRGESKIEFLPEVDIDPDTGKIKAHFVEKSRREIVFKVEYLPVSTNVLPITESIDRLSLQDVFRDGDLVDITKDVEYTKKQIVNDTIPDKAYDSDEDNITLVLGIAEKLAQAKLLPIAAMVVKNDTKEFIIGTREALPGITGKYYLSEGYNFKQHAEMSALKEAIRRGWDLSNTTLYISIEPCHRCSRAIMNTYRVGRVVFANVDTNIIGQGMAVFDASNIDWEITDNRSIRERAHEIGGHEISQRVGGGIYDREFFNNARHDPEYVLDELERDPSTYGVQSWGYINLFDWAMYWYLKKKGLFSSEEYPAIYSIRTDVSSMKYKPKLITNILRNGVRVSNGKYKLVLVGPEENGIKLAQEILENEDIKRLGFLTADRIYILPDRKDPKTMFPFSAKVKISIIKGSLSIYVSDDSLDVEVNGKTVKVPIERVISNTEERFSAEKERPYEERQRSVHRYSASPGYVLRDNLTDVSIKDLKMADERMRNFWTVLRLITYGEEKLKEGLLSYPPVVVKAGDEYIINSGHHRLLAAWIMGIENVEVKLIDIRDPENISIWEKTFMEGGGTFEGNFQYFIEWLTGDLKDVPKNEGKTTQLPPVEKSIGALERELKRYSTEFKGLDLVPDVNGKKVLDIGTGLGPLAYWAKENGASQVTGIDSDGILIDRAKTIAGEKDVDITFEVADATDLSYPEGGYDVVVGSKFFGFIGSENRKKVLRGVYNVLKKGGSVLFVDHHDGVYMRENGHIMRVHEVGKRWTSDKYWSGEEWEKELKEAGFTDIKIQWVWEDGGPMSAFKIIYARKPDDFGKVHDISERVMSPVFDSGTNPFSSKEILSKLIERFRQITRGVYPLKLIEKIKRKNNNPIVIGYDHPDLSNLAPVKNAFLKLKEANPNKTLKVALELIPPKQIEWIKIFVRDEKEYNERGTINGGVPAYSTVQNLRAYRGRISANRSFGEMLALWLLDNGFEVIPLDHENVESWMKEDSTYESEEETFFGYRTTMTRPALTAIKRDIYGLEVIDKEEPDIISAGSAHALKYDLLLERDGSRSFYTLTGGFTWDKLFSLWDGAHSIYRNLHSGLPNPNDFGEQSEGDLKSNIVFGVTESTLFAESNDEKYLLDRASKYLAKKPVNMHIDIKSIPDGEEELNLNIRTIAYMIIRHDTMGLNARYLLGNDNNGKAMSILKEAIISVGKETKIDVDGILSNIGVPHESREAIDIKLYDSNSIADNMPIGDREYVVILSDNDDSGVRIPNYTAATVIGLTLAYLRVNNDDIAAGDSGKIAEYNKLRKEVLEKVRIIYKRSRVIDNESQFSEDDLDLMVTGSSTTKMYLARVFSFPPIIKLVEGINEFHKMLRFVLQSA